MIPENADDNSCLQPNRGHSDLNAGRLMYDPSGFGMPEGEYACCTKAAGSPSRYLNGSSSISISGISLTPAKRSQNSYLDRLLGLHTHCHYQITARPWRTEANAACGGVRRPLLAQHAFFCCQRTLHDCGRPCYGLPAQTARYF